jgi:hypothetical protein
MAGASAVSASMVWSSCLWILGPYRLDDVTILREAEVPAHGTDRKAWLFEFSDTSAVPEVRLGVVGQDSQKTNARLRPRGSARADPPTPRRARSWTGRAG